MQRKSTDERNKESAAQQKPLGEHIQQSTETVVKEAQQEVATARVPWYRAIRRGRTLVIADTIVLALFALLAWWVYIHPVLAVDVKITREFQETQAPWLYYTMVAVSYIGNVAWLSAGLIVLAAVIFWIVRLRLEAVMIVVVSATSGILNTLLKALVGRPRPATNLVEVIQAAGGKSFPSGHVMSYVAFWGLLFSFGVILFKGKRWWRVALLIVPALFVILVGPSRVYLGDHWASDVLGAYLISGTLLSIALWVYLKLKARGVLAVKKTVQGQPLENT
jgi:membrane-associated phospholipid phosphatase